MKNSHNIRFIQAHINNCKGIPVSVDDMLEYFEYHAKPEIEDLLYENHTEWTVPKWTKKGDIVFFMIQKEMHKTAAKLKKELEARKDEFSAINYAMYYSYVNKCVDLINKYHGKIIAVGMISGVPTFDANDPNTRWKSSIYASVSPLCALENPIDISKFNDFIRVSRQSAITGVFGEDYEKLKQIISRDNDIPDFLKCSSASPLPYNKINKDTWLSISNEFRRNFILEAQFRAYYVDYLLAELKDKRTKTHSECTCKKQGNPDVYIDNIISFNGTYLMVEDKLNVAGETNIKAQVKRYCDVDICVLDKKTSKQEFGTAFYRDKVLIIDTGKIYLYDMQSDTVKDLYDLDNLHDVEDIKIIKHAIEQSLREQKQ